MLKSRTSVLHIALNRLCRFTSLRLLLLLVGCWLCAPAYSAEKPVLHWCLDHFPRFHEFHGRNPPIGPSVDLMQELALRAGFELKYSSRTPVARCFRQMGTGEADLMVNLNHNAEREQLMFMLPYNENIPESLYLQASDPRKIEQLSQLSQLRMVTVRNYTYSATLMTLLKSQRHHLEVDSIAAGFELLRKGRVDGVIVPTQSSLEVIRNNAQLHYKFRKAALSFKFPERRYVHIGFSRHSKHPEMKAKLEQAINSMMQDGTVQRLYRIDQEKIGPTFLVED
jgi:ABC-type amino acid transport substrate-binding protein